MPYRPFAERRGASRAVLLVATALLVVTVGVAAWFWGDIPHRYQAAQEVRAGRVALLGSDLPTALAHFRAAALLRPDDGDIVQQYDQTQGRWVQMVEGKLAKLEGIAAYRALHELPPTEDLLVEPHRSRLHERVAAIEEDARKAVAQQLAEATAATEAAEFDRAYAILNPLAPVSALIPDLTARIQAVQEAQIAHVVAQAEQDMDGKRFQEARAALQTIAAIAGDNPSYRELGPAIDAAEVRAALESVQQALQKADLATAHDQLERAEKVKALPEQVAAARENFLRTARGQLAVELARAIVAGQSEPITALMEKGKAYAGWRPVPAEALLKPTDLASFLQTLESFDLGTKSQQSYVNRLDVPLVTLCRTKFRDAEVSAFLREGFTRWSRVAQEKRLPGLALLLDEQAGKYGATSDHEWRKAATQAAIASTFVTIAVAPPDKNATSPAGLNEPATNALRQALQSKLGAWPKLVDYDPKRLATVVFVGIYNGFTAERNVDEVVTKSVRYQSGTRQVRNAEAEDLHLQYTDLLERRNAVVDSVNDKQRTLDELQRNQNDAYSRSRAGDLAIDIASSKALVSQWDRRLDSLRAQGRSLPRYLTEPVYADEEYQLMKLVYTCRLHWKIDALLHGQTVSVAQRTAETTFRTEEVVGNASHGVPVRDEDPVPEEKLTRQLVKPLVAKAGNVDDLISALPDLTLQSFLNFHKAKQTSDYKIADQCVALVYAWEAAGQKTSFKARAFEYARQLLNLAD